MPLGSHQEIFPIGQKLEERQPAALAVLTAGPAVTPCPGVQPQPWPRTRPWPSTGGARPSSRRPIRRAALCSRTMRSWRCSAGACGQPASLGVTCRRASPLPGFHSLRLVSLSLPLTRSVVWQLISEVGSNLVEGKSLLAVSLPVALFEPRSFLGTCVPLVPDLCLVPCTPQPSTPAAPRPPPPPPNR